MTQRMVGALAAALAWAAPAGAADIMGIAPVRVVAADPGTVALRATPLEGVREVYPRVGRNVVANLDGAAVPTIEWRIPIELRVRTFSGVPLTEGQKAAVVALAPECLRGEPRDVSTRVEVNLTFVVLYDCVWLQGFEPGPLALFDQ